jgi:hypothetical protein
MLSSYEPTMDACCKGDTSELNDGRLGLKKAGVGGVEPTAEKVGVEFSERRGW